MILESVIWQLSRKDGFLAAAQHGRFPETRALAAGMRKKTTRETPPKNYEAVIKAIQQRYDEFSRAYQKIARFIVQHPDEVAMHSITLLAERGGVHPSSLVRFSQMLGFDGFKDIQAVFQSRLATAAQGFEARVAALKEELQSQSQQGYAGLLGNLVARDIACLQDLLNAVTEKNLGTAVNILAKADTIYLLGQLRSAPVAVFMRYVLTMLQRRTVLLDADGGLSTEMARAMKSRDCLIATSFRYYAKEVVTVVENARRAGIPVIVISDGALSPLAKAASVRFDITGDEYSFSRSLAAPMCLAQALMLALAAKLNPDASRTVRIPVMTELRR